MTRRFAAKREVELLRTDVANLRDNMIEFEDILAEFHEVLGELEENIRTLEKRPIKDEHKENQNLPEVNKGPLLKPEGDSDTQLGVV